MYIYVNAYSVSKVSFVVFVVGQTFFSRQESFYLIFNDLPQNEWKTWSGARDACREIGYDLVTINDASEDRFLRLQLGP